MKSRLIALLDQACGQAERIPPVGATSRERDLWI